MRALSLCVALGTLPLLTGCPPPPNLLDGSIKTSHDLSFDDVELRYRSDTLVYELAYFKNLDETGEQRDTVVKVVFNEPAGGATVDQPIDLTAEQAEAVVQRVTAADDPFPTEFETASVTFLSAPTVGEIVKGEFAVTFVNGRTLNGAFETVLLEAGFVD